MTDFWKCLSNPALINCYFSNCKISPGNEIKEILKDVFKKHLMEMATFHQWIYVERCNLEILKVSADKFVDICRDLKSSQP